MQIAVFFALLAFAAAYPQRRVVEKEEVIVPAVPYEFGYKVAAMDPFDRPNMQAQEEHMDGDVLNGQYMVLEPDNVMRIVTYNATKEGGFQAKVERIPYSGDLPKGENVVETKVSGITVDGTKGDIQTRRIVLAPTVKKEKIVKERRGQQQF